MMTRNSMLRGRGAGIGIVVAAAVVAAATWFAGVMPASSQAQVVRAGAAADIPGDPYASFWNDVAPVDVALSTQNVARPMGGGTVASVKVRAAHDGERLYIVAEWPDRSQDTAADTTTAFADAAAVEFPAAGTTRVPSFCMGDPAAGVNIWHWKAAWQSDMASGFATNRARYTDMLVDTYPQADDPTFQTGLAAGNPVSAREHESAVENLVAAQYGTLTHADVQDVGGQGEWRNGTWRVLFTRTLQGADGEPAFTPGAKTNAAFAVWNGSEGQRDGIKSVSQFIDLEISGDKIAGTSNAPGPALFAFAGIVLSLVLIAGFGVWVERQRNV